MRRIFALVATIALLIAGANATTIPLTGAGKPPPLSFSYITFVADTGNLSTYTFSTTAIGEPNGGRCIFIGIMGNQTNNSTITGATIDGNAMSELLDVSNGNANVGFYSRSWPTGTTATFTVTFSAAKARAGIAVWAVYGKASCTTTTDTDSSTASPGSYTLTTSVNGAVFTVATVAASAASATFTNVTERFDQNVEASTVMAGADAPSTGANITPTITYNAAPTQPIYGGIAIGP